MYDFSVGEPDFTTPEHICQAAVAAMKAGHTHYTVASGIPELRTADRQAVSRQRHGLEYAPARSSSPTAPSTRCTTSSPRCCNPGDEVIIPAPYWVSYAELVKLTGAVPGDRRDRARRTTSSSRRRSCAAAITPKTTMLLICSPSNPTGSMYSPEELGALADVVIEKNLTVVSDEIYERLVYGNHQFASFATRAAGHAGADRSSSTA